MELKQIDLDERPPYSLATGAGTGNPKSLDWRENVDIGSQIHLEHNGQVVWVTLQERRSDLEFVGEVSSVPSDNFPVQPGDMIEFHESNVFGHNW